IIDVIPDYYSKIKENLLLLTKSKETKVVFIQSISTNTSPFGSILLSQEILDNHQQISNSKKLKFAGLPEGLTGLTKFPVHIINIATTSKCSEEQ
ncbi:23948_t:CDS:1, partial [Dentiscutata erythropus]